MTGSSRRCKGIKRSVNNVHGARVCDVRGATNLFVAVTVLVDVAYVVNISSDKHENDHAHK